MLEIARMCKKGDVDLPLEFVSFNLEEENPFLHNRILQKGIELDLYNEFEIPKTLHFQKMRDLFQKKSKKALDEGIDREKTYEKAFSEIEDSLTEVEREYFRCVINLTRKPESRNWIGFFAVNGSSYYVEDLVKNEALNSLKGVINLETCGYTSTKPHSQTLPKGLDARNFPSYKIDDPTVGDFITVVSDRNSLGLGNSFLESCEESDIDLPCVLIGVPLNFDQITKSMPDLLRSDHAPFWKAGVPALMVTDTANFRNPYYHTPADTITTLDFDYILKVAKATFLTALRHFK
ncbi:MAG: M28 family peptidase [Theionarchaea archaeon]|nr:M28 family peptidase [Theionarchaea archaeon]